MSASLALDLLLCGKTLTTPEADSLMAALLRGELAEPAIEQFLTALHKRNGATTVELAGFLAAIQAARTPVQLTPEERDHIVDTCGTGGDGSNTFNISTAAALVAAAAGAPVAKHGNRKVTSRCGSADILERLGIPIDHTPATAVDHLRRHRFAFLLAPIMHPAMRHAAPVRRRLPFRTVFNLLGPMANPVGARRQLLGVYSREAVTQVAQTLAHRGTMLHALVVHGTTHDGSGLDEISLSGPTLAASVQGATIRMFELTPEDAGIPSSHEDLPGGDTGENAAILHAIFSNEPGSARDIVLLNAAAVLHVAGKATDLKQGRELAAQALAAGSVTRLIRAIQADTKLA